MVIGFRGGGQAVSHFIDATGNVPTIHLAFDDIASGSAVGPRETVAGSLKMVEFSGDTVNNGTLGVYGYGTAVETFKGSMTSNSTLNIDNSTIAARANVQTVDLSGSTGNLTVNAANFTNSFTKLLGGSGNDTLLANNAVANAPTLLVDGGSGNDKITFINTKSAVASASSLTGGDGADTFTLTGGSNLVAANSTTALKASLTTITDFNAAQDTLNITGMALGGRVAQNVVNAAANGADLFAVTTAVANVTGVGQHSFFEFGGDTYLFGNIAGGGLQATDTLVQLTGVSVASLTAANLIG